MLQPIGLLKQNHLSYGVAVSERGKCFALTLWEQRMAEENYLGRIEISPNAIASLAGQQILECYGVVGMANKNLRDGIVEVLTRGNYRRGIDVRVVEHEIYIDLYVVIQYGTRISEVAHGIMNRVKYGVQKALGLPVAQVNVYVQGLHVDEQA
jgi:uncharacterized alkaline shock family protein YloU